ncbi:class I SAM-dependent methyltransferase [Egibacter rhizosphaerae]|uniref:Class I SAM-dependent methyltransferase n=1 Tax=Egibacter rhizosphaerae TaxID=1670831 RepID=A0A411YCX5_9ACTN|nr:class I SAM-dependent methyltransferase [Egibacter rhizosphaerae]QBI19081.1 class I SAM-dependent methyltransferase [Egibacter rhizosphaerae]
MAGVEHERASRAREVWSLGDYERVGARWAQAPRDVVASLDVAGQAVLDVGCGTGEAALAAARAGAAGVTACDPTPELLAVARDRASAGGLSVAWDEGEAQELPYPDASFDLVLSTFGVMFAPDAHAAAAELVRVCRPGGRIVTTAWTPD